MCAAMSSTSPCGLNLGAGRRKAFAIEARMTAAPAGDRPGSGSAASTLAGRVVTGFRFWPTT